MNGRLWEAADAVAHFLYEPALLGKRCAAVPDRRMPLHRMHLIPGAWLEKVCARHDRYLGVED